MYLLLKMVVFRCYVSLPEGQRSPLLSLPSPTILQWTKILPDLRGDSDGLIVKSPSVDDHATNKANQGPGVCGCFLKWRYPPKHPKLSFLVGKPIVVGYHHFRKPPCRRMLSRQSKGARPLQMPRFPSGKSRPC